MKLMCDLCGSPLVVNSGGKDASCSNCGLNYSMERLREKLGQNKEVHNEPVRTAPQNMPKQFVMELRRGKGDISGYIRQGGIGLGDEIYVDNNYRNGYTVYSINDSDQSCAKAGSYVELYLDGSNLKALKRASVVTGAPKPQWNAYNFPGTVDDYFEQLLKHEFGDYEIRTNLRHPQLFIPVNFVLYRGGRPVAAVLLINSNDTTARWQAAKAVKVLSPAGVAATHFFNNYRNDASYVIDRIHKAMGTAVQ